MGAERPVAAVPLRTVMLLALAAFLVLLLSGRSVDLLGSPARIGLVIAWVPVAAATWLTARAVIPVAYVALGGLWLRWLELPAGGAGPSDHLAATYEAIDVLVRGGNPYDHVYQLTRPPASPVSQPPGELLVHLPGYLAAGLAGVQFTELVLAGAVMALLIALGVRVGWTAALPALALYAGAPNLVLLTTDGSNDTGAGALLLFAAVALGIALVRQLRNDWILAGAVAALALATKQLALPVGVALAALAVRRAGRAALPYVAALLGTLLLLSLPFLLMGPGTFLAGLLRFIGAHDDIYGWNIWALAQGLGLAPWDAGPAAVLSLVVAAGVIAVLALLPYRTLAGAALAGALGLLAILLTARWTTYAYFGMVAPLALAIPLLAAWQPGSRRAEGMA